MATKSLSLQQMRQVSSHLLSGFFLSTFILPDLSHIFFLSEFGFMDVRCAVSLIMDNSDWFLCFFMVDLSQ
jgi:hypothetical protein